MKFRFPIVIIDEDFRSENTSGLGIRALADAMEKEGMEVVGVFGVDSIKNGKCPDGVAYDWNKASRIGRVKKERV